MKKVLMFVHWVSTIALNLAMIVGFYYYFIDCREPIKFGNLPFPTEKMEYKRGEKMNITIDYCKKKNLPSKMYANFTGGIVYEMTPRETSGLLPIGCHTQKMTIDIPHNLPLGEYVVSGSNVYKVNFLREEIVEWSTRKISVVE